MTEFYSDAAVTLHHGDALDVLRALDDGSADCLVTSPPYFGLRDYGVEGQQGLEKSPTAYVAGMVAVLREVRRVLADDGTLWLNIGDSYSAKRPYQVDQTKVQASGKSQPYDTLADRPAKSMLGIPWRLALALQDDGWILRNEIIWAKPNAMPESVRDRFAGRHEHVFLFSKKPRYWFDLDCVREAPTTSSPAALTWDRESKEARVPGQSMKQHRKGRDAATPPGAPPQTNFGPGGANSRYQDQGKNPGDVWTIPTQPFSEAHFAVMPVALAERCIASGCKPGGTVLDPYSGSGTTGLAAARLGRRYVGIDLNREYLELSLRTRLAQTSLLDGEASA